MEEELLGEPAVKVEFQFLYGDGLAKPGLAIDLHEPREVLLTEAIHTLEVEILLTRHPAEHGFDGIAPAIAAVDDPLEHAHVFAEAGPEELARRVLAEPVDVENARRSRSIACACGASA